MWPVKLWPLIDCIKNCENDDDEFMNYLGDKLNEVTYYTKFKEWPNNIHEISEKDNKVKYNFEDLVANEFSKLLLMRWGKKYQDELHFLLTKIEKNLLFPEFPIPEDEKELEKFVGIENYTEKEKRELRQELRNIAKKDSEAYI